MSKRSHYYIFLIICLSIFSCRVKVPSDVIPEDKMENILQDYYLAKAVLDNNYFYTINTKSGLYMEYVFDKHGITKAEFDSSLLWYSRNSLVLEKVYERLEKKFMGSQELLDRVISERNKDLLVTENADSVNVWRGLKNVRLNGNRYNDIYLYKVKPDSNYYHDDALEMSVDVQFDHKVEKDSNVFATMAMVVYYDLDTIVKLDKVFASGNKKIRIQADSVGEIREIKGFISYKITDSLRSKELLLNNIQMMRLRSAKPDSLVSSDSIN